MLLVFSISCFVFGSHVTGAYHLLPTIQLIFSGIVFIFPYGMVLNFFSENKDFAEFHSYEENKVHFNADYSRSNPINFNVEIESNRRSSDMLNYESI